MNSISADKTSKLDTYDTYIISEPLISVDIYTEEKVSSDINKPQFSWETFEDYEQQSINEPSNLKSNINAGDSRLEKLSDIFPASALDQAYVISQESNHNTFVQSVSETLTFVTNSIVIPPVFMSIHPLLEVSSSLPPIPSTIHIVNINEAPIGTSGTVTTLEDHAYTFAASNFGFTDPNDNPANNLAAVEITTLPLAGSLTDHGVAVTAGQFISVADISAGNLIFTPAANANGAGYANFTFQVQDDGGTANGGVNTDPTPKTLTVDVTSVNDAPVGTSGTVTTLEDHAYTFAASNFGFTDPNDNPANNLAAVEITTLPIAGSLTDHGVAVTAGQFISVADISAGNLVFTPAANANGAGYASFTFQVQDDGGTANGGVNTDPTPKTLTVDVTSVNDAPVGTDNTITTDTNYVFAKADFGFTDPNDAPPNNLAAVEITTLPGSGTLTDNGVAVTAGQFISVTDINAGNLVYAPVNGGSSTSFTFQVQDDGGTANGGVNTDPTPKTLTINIPSETLSVANFAELSAAVTTADGFIGQTTINVTGAAAFNFTNDLNVTSNITINMNDDIFNGQSLSQLFSVITGASLTINGQGLAAALENGVSTQGGAIDSAGNLNINEVIIRGNSVTTTNTGIGASSISQGGAIYNDHGNVIITDSTLSGNTVTSTATGLNAISSAQGGAIYNNDGSVTILNTTVSGNTATSTATGTGAQSDAEGGAIYTLNGTVSISDSSLSGNTVTSTGTGVGSTSVAEGGGVYLNTSTLTNTNVNYSGNTPDDVFSSTTGSHNYTLPATGTVTPVILDLIGNGIHLTSSSQSNETLGEISGTNSTLPVGWITPGEGVLMLNSNGNGTLTNINQISFASYLPGAQTDLQGLAAFDTNHDGILSSADANFALFGVLLANGDFETLTQLGITSISLTSNHQSQTLNGNTIFGLTTYQTVNGQTHLAADAALSIGTASTASLIHSHDVISSQYISPAIPSAAPHSWSPSQNAGVAYSHQQSIADHLQVHHIVHEHG